MLALCKTSNLGATTAPGVSGGQVMGGKAVALVEAGRCVGSGEVADAAGLKQGCAGRAVVVADECGGGRNGRGLPGEDRGGEGPVVGRWRAKADGS